MPGHARFTALLDACVLHPVAVADSLLSVYLCGLFAPKWTEQIEQEWMRSLAREKQKPVELFQGRRDRMRAAVPDWEVPEAAWSKVARGLSLPDADDVHVLAAAIAGHADCIVTFNLRDFPDSELAPFGIEAIHPDEFLIAQLDLDPYATLAAFKDQRARLKRPDMSALQFADALERNRLIVTAQRLRDAAELI